MARGAHDATWRALRRVVDVLIANVGTQLSADAPAGLDVTAPVAEAYYCLPNEAAVRDHTDRNHFVQVYVYPSGERVRFGRSMGATVKSQRSTLEITIAVRVSEQLSAATFADTWKTLTAREREFLRCETLLGAIQDSIDSAVRNPDDVVNADFISARSGDPRFGDGATWGTSRWVVHQIINVPVQA